MQTFLIVVGIILAIGVVGALFIIAKLRSLAVRGTTFLVRTGIAAIKETAQAEHISINIRERIAEVEREFNALPAPNFFNAKELVVAHMKMLETLAAITKDMAAEDAEHRQNQPQVIEGEAVDVTVSEPLALLPPPTVTSEDSIVTAFKAEWMKPDGFILDAWIEERGEDRFLMYQLNPDMDMSDLGKVPGEFQGLPTVITWFPRDQK